MGSRVVCQVLASTLRFELLHRSSRQLVSRCENKLTASCVNGRYFVSARALWRLAGYSCSIKALTYCTQRSDESVYRHALRRKIYDDGAQGRVVRSVRKVDMIQEGKSVSRAAAGTPFGHGRGCGRRHRRRHRRRPWAWAWAWAWVSTCCSPGG